MADSCNKSPELMNKSEVQEPFVEAQGATEESLKEKIELLQVKVVEKTAEVESLEVEKNDWRLRVNNVKEIHEHLSEAGKPLEEFLTTNGFIPKDALALLNRMVAIYGGAEEVTDG